MPELPEVEGFRRSLLKHCLNKPVESASLVECGGGDRNGKRDEKILDSAIKDTDFVGRSLINVHRRGKHLILLFNDDMPSGPDFILHFGLTGLIKIRTKGGEEGKSTGAIQYFSAKSNKSSEAEAVWPPKFTKLLIHFNDDTEMAFVDPRRLGKITRVKQPGTDDKSLAALAPDPVHDLPSEDEFALLMSKSGNRPIKTILLDQNSVVCGLGNYLVDEICHDAHVHPNSKRALLSKEDVSQLRKSIHSIVTQACECDERGEDFPAHWIFHGRWDSKKAKLEKSKITGIKEIKVGGRATFFDPKTQHVLGSSNAVDEEYDEEEEEEKDSKKKAPKGKKKVKAEAASEEEEEEEPMPRTKKRAKVQ